MGFDRWTVDAPVYACIHVHNVMAHIVCNQGAIVRFLRHSPPFPSLYLSRGYAKVQPDLHVCVHISWISYTKMHKHHAAESRMRRFKRVVEPRMCFSIARAIASTSRFGRVRPKNRIVSNRMMDETRWNAIDTLVEDSI